MVTSRTGGTKYLNNRARLLAEAQAEGIERCPGYVDESGLHHPCGVVLDYETPGLPNSAEADHIIPWRDDGSDDYDNLRLLCRKQNQERNRSQPPPPAPLPEMFPILGGYLTDKQAAKLT